MEKLISQLVDKIATKFQRLCRIYIFGCKWACSCVLNIPWEWTTADLFWETEVIINQQWNENSTKFQRQRRHEFSLFHSLSLSLSLSLVLTHAALSISSKHPFVFAIDTHARTEGVRTQVGKQRLVIIYWCDEGWYNYQRSESWAEQVLKADTRKYNQMQRKELFTTQKKLMKKHKLHAISDIEE